MALFAATATAGSDQWGEADVAREAAMKEKIDALHIKAKDGQLRTAAEVHMVLDGYRTPAVGDTVNRILVHLMQYPCSTKVSQSQSRTKHPLCCLPSVRGRETDHPLVLCCLCLCSTSLAAPSTAHSESFGHWSSSCCGRRDWTRVWRRPSGSFAKSTYSLSSSSTSASLMSSPLRARAVATQ